MTFICLLTMHIFVSDLYLKFYVCQGVRKNPKNLFIFVCLRGCMIFQILDVDYSLNNGKPIVRLYGKSSNGNPVCFFYDKFFPYFYIRTDKSIEEISQKIEAANIEEVEMRLAVGYRTEKTKLIKITIFNPQEVPVLRERLIKEKIAQE